MAGKKPSFITGANAKIKSGGLTLAYAQDVNYSTTVDVVPIETMGRYEVVSNEPVGYRVEGTLNVVRYTKIAQANGMQGAAAGGNGVGKWAMPTGGTGSQHLNPGDLLASQTWDLEIFQKFDNAGAIDSTKVVKIKDCRFRSKGGAINKRGVLVENFSFVAILGEDDSFDSSNSGDTDLSST